MITRIKKFLTNSQGEENGGGVATEDELDWAFCKGWDEMFEVYGAVYYVALEDGRRGRLISREFVHSDVDDEDKDGLSDFEGFPSSIAIIPDILAYVEDLLERYPGAEAYINLMGGPFGRHDAGVFFQNIRTDWPATSSGSELVMKGQKVRETPAWEIE